MTTQIRLKQFGLVPRKFRLRLKARREDKVIKRQVLRSLARSVPQATMSDEEYAEGLIKTERMSPYSNHFGSE